MFDVYDLLGITQLMEWKNRVFGTSKEEVYHSEQIKPKIYSFRPRTLTEYIGQERAKELININLQKIRTIKPVHFIISGSKGTGKSTLAYIIANELGFEISTYVAGSFTQENLVQFLVKNQDSEKPQILFVDEIHSLPKSLGEFMYPLLEDFLLPVGNIKVKPFIFIGATTDKNILQKRLAPMIDRCQSVNLEFYSSENIKLILKQYNDQLYKLNIEESDYDLLSANTRYTPRISINYFDDFVICKDIKKVLSAHQVIKNSLNTNDIIILKHLAEINKPIGVEVMSIITQQTKSDFMLLQEPFLISEGYISRTARGRCITEKGKELLRSLDDK
jgi:Holliday junction DNA helicase RuvB